MRVLNKRLSKYSRLFYVQIWEKKLKITEAPSGRVLEETPLVAVRTDKGGKQVIDAVGANAKLAAGPDVRVVNPFSHPRVLLSDFAVGEKVLAHFFRELSRGKFLAMRPVVIMHPMEKTEGGLTGIESRAWQELGTGAGAREVFIYDGTEIPLHNLQQGRFEAQEPMASLPEKKENAVGTVVSFVLFLLAILFAFLLMKMNGG